MNLPLRSRAFLFPPETAAWLTLLRIGLGAQVVFYCLSLRNDWSEMLGQGGHDATTREVAEAIVSIESRGIPTMSWLAGAGERFGLSEASVVSLVWWLLLLAGAFLMLGLLSRMAAVSAWFLHLCVAKSADFLVYGVDNFTTTGLFYLMLSPLPGLFALDRLLWKTPPARADLLGFFRRVLQIHLCLAYFFSGLSKALGRGWWNGSNLWRSLIRPPFNVLDPHLLLQFKSFFPLLGTSICLLELGYAVFIWPRRTRIFWLAGILLMHIAIALWMGMYLFGLIMITLNLAAFAPLSEFAPRVSWRRTRLPRRLT